MDNEKIEKTPEQIKCAMEAMLFVSGDPVGSEELAKALCIEKKIAQEYLLQIENEYRESERGILLRWINEKAQLYSNPAYAADIEALLQPEKKRKFSQSVIETLSIIAYKQPVTRAQIEEIRGVRCEYSLNQLLSLHLIAEAGRKQTIGRPALFATTDAFLELFDISSVDALPNREVFEQVTQDVLESIDV